MNSNEDTIYILPCLEELKWGKSKFKPGMDKENTQSRPKLCNEISHIKTNVGMNRNMENKCIYKNSYNEEEENLCTWDNSITFLEKNKNCSHIWNNLINFVNQKINGDRTKLSFNFYFSSHHNSLRKNILDFISKNKKIANCSCFLLKRINNEWKIFLIFNGFPDKKQYIKEYFMKFNEDEKEVEITNDKKWQKIKNNLNILPKNKEINLFFIRHGNALHNEPLKLTGGMFNRTVDTNLTPLGILQSRILGRYLVDNNYISFPSGVNINFFVASYLNRSQHTILGLIKELKNNNNLEGGGILDTIRSIRNYFKAPSPNENYIDGEIEKNQGVLIPEIFTKKIFKDEYEKDSNKSLDDLILHLEKADRKIHPNLDHFAQSKTRTAQGYRKRFIPHMPEDIQKRHYDDSYAKEVFYSKLIKLETLFTNMAVHRLYRKSDSNFVKFNENIKKLADSAIEMDNFVKNKPINTLRGGSLTDYSTHYKIDKLLSNLSNIYNHIPLGLESISSTSNEYPVHQSQLDKTWSEWGYGVEPPDDYNNMESISSTSKDKVILEPKKWSEWGYGVEPRYNINLDSKDSDDSDVIDEWDQHNGRYNNFSNLPPYLNSKQSILNELNKICYNTLKEINDNIHCLLYRKNTLAEGIKKKTRKGKKNKKKTKKKTKKKIKKRIKNKTSKKKKRIKRKKKRKKTKKNKN